MDRTCFEIVVVGVDGADVDCVVLCCARCDDEGWFDSVVMMVVLWILLASCGIVGLGEVSEG